MFQKYDMNEVGNVKNISTQLAENNINRAVIIFRGQDISEILFLECDAVLFGWNMNASGHFWLISEWIVFFSLLLTVIPQVSLPLLTSHMLAVLSDCHSVSLINYMLWSCVSFEFFKRSN